MKFHLTRPDGRNLITGYGPGYIAVNRERRTTSLLVLTDQLTEWDVRTHQALSLAAFDRLAGLPVEILLLGTGDRLHFPHPCLTQPLRDAGIGLEVMDTGAACRTYNILLAEDRRVGAALILQAAAELVPPR
jgi:uncharacterized protein